MSVSCDDTDQWEDYDVNSKEECCEKLRKYGFDVFGCASKHTTDDKIFNEKSCKMYQSLLEDYTTVKKK